MNKNTRSWVRITRWIARLWSLVPITFALAEVLFPHTEGSEIIPWTDWLALVIALLSIIGLAIAWRWELLGGWISLIALVVFTTLFVVTVDRSFPTVLIFLVGIGVPAGLFLISGYAQRT